MDSHWNKGDWLRPTQIDVVGLLKNIGRRGNEIIDSILAPVTEKKSPLYKDMSDNDKAMLFLKGLESGEMPGLTKSEQKKAWESLLDLGYDDQYIRSVKMKGDMKRYSKK